MNATAARAIGDDWMMGGSSDPAVRRDYGIGEQDIAALAVEAIFYAQSKAGKNRPRFVADLAMEFAALLCERLGIDPEDVPT